MLSNFLLFFGINLIVYTSFFILLKTIIFTINLVNNKSSSIDLTWNLIFIFIGIGIIVFR
jgi:hypothetical protein